MAGQDRYLGTPPDGNRLTRVGGRREMPAECSLTIRECGLPAAGNCRRICGHSSVGRTTPCQGVGRRFEAGCPLHRKAAYSLLLRRPLRHGNGWTVGLLVRSPPFESLRSSKHSRVEPAAPQMGSVELALDAFSRRPGWVRIPHGLPPSRGWHMGCAPAFQAGQTSSSLVPRSRPAAVAQFGRALR